MQRTFVDQEAILDSTSICCRIAQTLQRLAHGLCLQKRLFRSPWHILPSSLNRRPKCPRLLRHSRNSRARRWCS